MGQGARLLTNPAPQHLSRLLTSSRVRWRKFGGMQIRCGGCGGRPTAAREASAVRQQSLHWMGHTVVQGAPPSQSRCKFLRFFCTTSGTRPRCCGTRFATPWGRQAYDRHALCSSECSETPGVHTARCALDQIALSCRALFLTRIAACLQ